MSYPSEKPRSPIKSRFLRRLPGQSVSEARQRLYERSIEEPVVMAAGVFVLGGFEAIAGFVGWPRWPWLGLIAALMAFSYIFYSIFRVRPRMKALSLALEGERAVGQFLEELRDCGYKVFHDVPGDGFNIDHVIIGSAGVFSVETKTWSLPAVGRATLDFDGDTIRLAGKIADAAPVNQARAQASWLAELLVESTGRQYRVQPIVLFPGWYVRKRGGARRDVRVLNPRVFSKYLRASRVALSQEMSSMASFHLSRYIQSCK